jgi:hypothetical protein
MECAPGLNEELVSVAPPALSVIVARGFVPSIKAIVPVGVPEPLEVTVDVSDTLAP